MNRLESLKSMSLAQQFALLIGISFLLAGIGGFVPFVTTLPPNDAPYLSMTSNYGYLLGLFPINLLHNLFHLGTSFAGFWAFRQEQRAIIFSRFLAGILGLLAIMGLFPASQTTWGFFPLFGHDVWLHGLEALIGAYLGFIKK